MNGASNASVIDPKPNCPAIANPTRVKILSFPKLWSKGSPAEQKRLLRTIFQILTPTANSLQIYYWLTEQADAHARGEGTAKPIQNEQREAGQSAASLHFLRPEPDVVPIAGIPAIVKNGVRDVQVLEPRGAVKFVPARWNGVKIDLTELAKLRWIEKRSLRAISREFGKSRSTVCACVRTISKRSLSELNLTVEERETRPSRHCSKSEGESQEDAMISAIKLLRWVLSVAFLVGLVDGYGKIVHEMATAAMDAQEHQLSRAKFSRMLWSAKKHRRPSPDQNR